MSNVTVTNLVPKNLEWLGIGREAAATPGTLVVPSTTIPFTSAMPVDQAAMLVDKALRGDMGEDFNEVVGTLLGDLPIAGNVYLDSIGHLLYNLFGDYTAAFASAGSAAGSSTTSAVVGATTLTGTAFTAALPVGTMVAIANPSGPSEIVVLTAISTTTTLTFANTPLRFNHASGAVCTSAAAGAPVVHTFALLNGGGLFGLNAQAQPITHTVTHYNALQPNGTLNPTYTGYRQYGYWCASGMDVTMNTSNLFQHSTKGTCFFGQDNTNATGIANSQSDAGAQPDWRFQVALGAGASLTTSTGVINNIEQASISKVRQVVPRFALANQQNPVAILRYGFSVTGRLSWLAQDETPLLQMLAGTQQPLEIGMINGTGSWASPINGTQAIKFHFTRSQFEAAALTDPDTLLYDVGFRGLMNTTDIGVSGARGPMVVTLINSVATY